MARCAVVSRTTRGFGTSGPLDLWAFLPRCKTMPGMRTGARRSRSRWIEVEMVMEIEVEMVMVMEMVKVMEMEIEMVKVKVGRGT